MLSSWTWAGVLTVAAMVMVEFTDVGSSTITKAAMSKGMSIYVFVAYANALGTLFLSPSFILQKKISLTLSLIGGQFLLGLIGIAALLLVFNGLNYSSPTLESAVGNLKPVFTFILAIVFRMEKLDLRSSSSQAKVFGTIVSVFGASVVILYKGSVIFSPLSSHDHLENFMIISQQSKWVLGGFMLVTACILGAAWCILQTSLVKDTPSVITIVFIYNLLLTLQTIVISLYMERNQNAWVLRPDITMISIVISAISGRVIRIGIHTWCLQLKGPIYVVMFKPLGVAIAAVMVVVFLGEALHLGSVIGSIIIATGFYAVMWGQIKEKSTTNMENEVKSCLAASTQKTPLLQCRTSGDV